MGRRVPGPAPAVGELVDGLFRRNAARMVAYLTRVFGAEHLDLAEEVVQDALVKALQVWPHRGIPASPEGWLLAVARNGALDALRRHAALREREPAIAHELARVEGRDATAGADLRDDELRLILLCCHPALGRDARVALSLKAAAGFSVREIARAFLADEATIAQRLVRAKRQLRESGVELELPEGEALGERLDATLEVVYLLFNEGYAAHAGDDLVRGELCGEALRLGRLLADSATTGLPRVHALVALMAFQAARLPSRVNAAGEVVLLEDQDRRLWDRRLIALAFRHLERSIGGDAVSPYHLQAGIAAVHARESDGATTDWREILDLYDELLALQPSPVIALNRAVAISRVAGAEAGLAALEPLATDPALRRYYLFPAVRGGMLLESGAREAAARCFADALRLPCTEPERRFLRRRLAECGVPPA